MDRRTFLLRLGAVAAAAPAALIAGQGWASDESRSSLVLPQRKRIVYEGSDRATHYELLRYIRTSGQRVSGYELIGNRQRVPRGFDGEWGHGLYLAAVRDSRFSDIHISEVMGDGATITAKAPDGTLHGVTRDVTISDLHVDGARRNGIAFIGAERVTVQDFSIRDVRGAPRGPCAGVDFEPDGDTPGNRNLVLRDGTISDCQNFGIICDGNDTRNVLIERVTVRAHPEGWAIWPFFPGGRNVVRDCTFYGPSVHLRNVRFERCRFIMDRRYKQSDLHIASKHENVSLEDCTFE
jgi:hypothetical protein